MTHRLASIGECMIELSPLEDHTFGMSFAGDTLNMAIYCARSSNPSQLTVDYITALGDDHYSEEMLSRWQNEGVGTRLVHKIPGKLPGLYLIRNDEKGDREFYYYRSQAAARELFEGSVGDALCQELLNFNTIYLSGITLAILHESGREKLLATLKEAKKAGIVVCFDTNYRPRLWPNVAIAKATIQSVRECTQIALPSFEDVNRLFGDRTPEDTASRLRGTGVDEIVVKLGEKGYFLSSDEVHKLVQIQSVRVVDATAAGDSFNGAYLAARIQGLGTVEAAQKGAEMAARVVTYKGAIIPRAVNT
ncbi:sugar kinase [Candidiatus Paracoxiella cheracis]|uniref:sugar kinase n=1 Tax=Candidiatus Paracoxiella cheracis TaxID=3405120 RepID=UPI003BF4F16F